MEIRPIREEDISKVVPFYNICYGNSDVAEFAAPSLTQFKRSFLEKTEFSWEKSRVAVSDTEIVALLLVDVYEEERIAIVRALGVQPNQRRKGIAKMLMRDLSLGLATEGYRVIVAPPNIDERNQAAIGFFKSLGFQEKLTMLVFKKEFSSDKSALGREPVHSHFHVLDFTGVDFEQLHSALEMAFSDNPAGLTLEDLEEIVHDDWFLRTASFYVSVLARIVSFTMVSSNGNHPCVLYLGTVPQYRRQGLAKLLLAKSMKSLHTMGFEEVQAHVVPSNSSMINLLKKLHFGLISSRFNVSLRLTSK